ncbi:MAG: acyl carrier protein [Dehalococcoidia bacterium]
MSSVQERAIAIIAEQLRVSVDQVTPGSHLVDDLNADSLDVVDLTIAIEEEFSTADKAIEISEDVAAEMRTVQDVLDYLTSQGIA